MVMLDNRLYLVSIVEFLRRSRVDRRTRGGRVVVGTDLSKQKVSTHQQQIRNFNSLTVDVSVPTINTLHGMPSLLHLSSTQSKLGNCNVHFSGFDTDLSTPASVDDQINTNNDSVTGHVIEKCSFQRNTICLPPDIAFQVHLLSQMNTHQENDLNMLNEVI